MFIFTGFYYLFFNYFHFWCCINFLNYFQFRCCWNFRFLFGECRGERLGGGKGMRNKRTDPDFWLEAGASFITFLSCLRGRCAAAVLQTSLNETTHLFTHAWGGLNCTLLDEANVNKKKVLHYWPDNGVIVFEGLSSGFPLECLVHIKQTDVHAFFLVEFNTSTL